MPAPAETRSLVAEGAPRGGLAALCITQITGWGVLYYALSAAVRPISEDTGRDPAVVTGAFSAGLLVSAVGGDRRRQDLGPPAGAWLRGRQISADSAANSRLSLFLAPCSTRVGM